jgi:hypothetical protein
MANDLAAYHRGNPTPFSEPLLAGLRAATGSVNGHPVLMSGFSATPKQLEMVQSWISNLTSRLTPATEDEKAAQIARLVRGLVSQNLDDSAADMRMDEYFYVLEMEPIWAITRAVNRFMRGEVTDASKDFVPSPARFSTEVRRLVNEVRKDLIDLQRIADAAKESRGWHEIPAEREDNWGRLTFAIGGQEP